MPASYAPMGEVCTRFLASGSYVCNSSRVYVQGVGPGGIGQDGIATAAGGGASSGQALTGQYFPIIPGTVLTVQIGASGKQSGDTMVSGINFPTLMFFGGRSAGSGAQGYGEETRGDLRGSSSGPGNYTGDHHGAMEGAWIGGGAGGCAPAAGAGDDGREVGARCYGISGGASGHDGTGQNCGAGGASSPFGNGGSGGNTTTAPGNATGYGAGGGGGARGTANLIGGLGSPSFILLCS